MSQVENTKHRKMDSNITAHFNIKDPNIKDTTVR